MHGLPERLAGFRLTHLSDLHMGYVDGGGDRLADAVNREEPEAVFITGDFINRSRKLDPVLHLVSQLRPRFGIWVVMGNWERGWELDDEVLRRVFASRGATFLNNESQPVVPNDASLYVVGVDDAFFGAPDLHRALEGVPAEAVKIMLSHHPSMGPEGARRGIALTLSGHTHGGQFNIPGVPMRWLQDVEQRYLSGLFDLGDGYMYVSQGVGTTGPHFRIRTEGEIATFSLWPR